MDEPGGYGNDIDIISMGGGMELDEDMGLEHTDPAPGAMDVT